MTDSTIIIRSKHQLVPVAITYTGSDVSESHDYKAHVVQGFVKANEQLSWGGFAYAYFTHDQVVDQDIYAGDDAEPKAHTVSDVCEGRHQLLRCIGGSWSIDSDEPVIFEVKVEQVTVDPTWMPEAPVTPYDNGGGYAGRGDESITEIDWTNDESDDE